MGIIAAPGNASFPHADWCYNASPADLVDPPLAYGYDLTITDAIATCPRPVFTAGGWISTYLFWYDAFAWQTRQIVTWTSPTEVRFYDPPPTGNVSGAKWHSGRPSNDSAIHNVATRYSRHPDPLPCTIHNGVLWIASPDYATLKLPRYHRP